MRASLFLALLVMVWLAFASASFDVDVPGWKSCAASDFDANVTSIVANEWPPKRGEQLVLNGTGTNSKNITSGTYTITIHVDGLPLPSISGDIDDFHPLPWAVGNLTFSFTETIPSAAPKGDYTIQIAAVDQDKHGIFCIAVSAKISAAEKAQSEGLLHHLLQGGAHLRKSFLGAGKVPAKPAKMPALQRMKRRL